MQELNHLRKQAMLGTAIGFGILGIGFLLFIASPFIGMFLFISGGAIALVVSNTTGKKYKELYKSIICKTVLEKLFEVKTYDPKLGFSEDYIRDTYLISMGNRFSSDDYLSGSYKGVEFERCDVDMKNVTSTGKTTTTVTYFKGSWNVFTFPKTISSYLVIKEKEFLSNSRPGGIFSSAPRTQKVLFEDIDFNERFVVFAQDEHDAFYVCTPHFIEKIKSLETLADGRLIIGIMNQKVHILFDNYENAMEPSLYKEVTETDFKQVENEMKLIIDIMNILGFIEN